MNTNKGARGLMPKLQRILLAALAVIVLFGSFPITHVKAATNGWWPSVHCDVGAIRHNISVQGAYGQWARYRLYIYRYTPYVGWSQPDVYGWYYVQTLDIAQDNHLYYANSGTLEILTELQYLVGNSWVSGGSQYGTHFQPWAETQNDYPWCSVY